MDVFEAMLCDKEDSVIRNNLAFCQLLVGDVTTGLANARKALEGEYTPLHELNKGIGEFLIGSTATAKDSLRNALRKLHEPESPFDTDAAYVLVIDAAESNCDAHSELPVDAAILINLWRMDDLTVADLEAKLVTHYPKEAQAWLNKFTALE